MAMKAIGPGEWQEQLVVTVSGFKNEEQSHNPEAIQEFLLIFFVLIHKEIRTQKFSKMFPTRGQQKAKPSLQSRSWFALSELNQLYVPTQHFHAS